MNAATIFVLGILAIVVILIIRNMIRDKRNGKPITCGRSCAGCSSPCAYHKKPD